MIADLGASIDNKLVKQEERIADVLDKKFDEKLFPLTEKVTALEVKVTEIEMRINEAEDIAARVNNLMLSGLPFEEGENLTTIFRKLSAVLGYAEPPEVRLYRFNGNDKDKRSIRITFATEYHKLQFLQNYYVKAKDLKRDLFPSFPNDVTRLFLQHDFTTPQYKLNKAAMAFKKDKLVQKVSVNAGNKITVQIAAGEKFLAFSTAQDLIDEIDRRKKRAANQNTSNK